MGKSPTLEMLKKFLGGVDLPAEDAETRPVGDDGDEGPLPPSEWDRKRVPTVMMKLTVHELAHMYDLMSVRTSTTEEAFVSAQLASATGNDIAEQSLFNKVRELCEVCGVPVDDEAMEYVVGQAAPVKLGVFPLNEE